ncbi:MAG: abhydrolase 18 [Schlesneria sp.]|nr:abhydrolase 18 [Schlesneria sp.]
MLNRTLLAVALVCVAVTMPVDAWAEDTPKAPQTFYARDTIAPQPDDSADAKACIDHLIWKPGDFKVTIEPASDSEIDGYIRFPSPKPNGIAQNDLVALEWYAARDEQGRMIDAPAVVVVHESGSGMDVGRLFAKAFHAKNLHAFMIQLPFYGLRRPTGFRPDGRHVEATMVQGIADVRRARDAVAVIPQIIRTNIALQGTSLGGFVAATTAGLDHGYQSVHIMVAGGDLHSLVVNGQREAGKLREMLATAGYTGDKLRDLFNQVEPLRLAHRLDPTTTWMYSATRDQVVPPIHAFKLARAARLAEDHHIQLLADHYTGIIYMPIVVDAMSKKILGESP